MGLSGALTRLGPFGPLSQLPVSGNTLREGLFVFHKHDETAGNDRVDSIGSYDITESSTSGTVGQTSSGKVGSATDFDASNLERLTHAHAAALSMHQTRMFAGWVYLDSVSGTQRLRGSHNAGIGGSSWLLYMNGSTLTFRLTDGSSSDELTVTGLSTATWYYVELYYDDSDGSFGLAATPDSSSTVNSFTSATCAITPQEGTADFAVGASGSGGAASDGRQDNWAGWTVVKSVADRNAAFNSGDGLALSEWQASSGTAGDLTPVGSSSTTSAAAISALGSVTAQSTASTPAAVAIAALGSVAVAGHSGTASVADLSAFVDVEADGSAVASARAALTGLGSVTAAGSTTTTATVSFEPDRALDPVGSSTTSGAVILSGLGALSAAGVSGSTTTATLSAIGSVVASSTSSLAGAATLEALGGMSAAGRAVLTMIGKYFQAAPPGPETRLVRGAGVRLKQGASVRLVRRST